jgi:hypothetical protein
MLARCHRKIAAEVSVRSALIILATWSFATGCGISVGTSYILTRDIPNLIARFEVQTIEARRAHAELESETKATLKNINTMIDATAPHSGR